MNEPTTTAASVGPGRLIAIDRMIELTPGVRAVGYRHVPNTLDILDTHFPRFPVLPGVVLLGSLGAVGVALAERTVGGRWALVGADTARFRHYVRPGDVVELTVEWKRDDGDRVVCAATAKVDGRSVATVRRLHLRRIDGPLDESTEASEEPLEVVP